jgi:hypothetical protein
LPAVCKNDENPLPAECKPIGGINQKTFFFLAWIKSRRGLLIQARFARLRPIGKANRQGKSARPIGKANRQGQSARPGSKANRQGQAARPGDIDPKLWDF